MNELVKAIWRSTWQKAQDAKVLRELDFEPDLSVD